MTGNLKTSPSAQTQMRKAKGKADKGSRSLLLYAAPHHLTPRKASTKKRIFLPKMKNLLNFPPQFLTFFSSPHKGVIYDNFRAKNYRKFFSHQKNTKINLQKSSRAHLVECAADCWMIANETFSSFAGSEWNFLCLAFVVVLMCCEARLSPISSFGRKLSARLCLSRIFTKQLAWKLWFVATDFGT